MCSGPLWCSLQVDEMLSFRHQDAWPVYGTARALELVNMGSTSGFIIFGHPKRRRREIKLYNIQGKPWATDTRD